MNDQVIFIISFQEISSNIHEVGGNQILTSNLVELNKIINDLEKNFLLTIDKNIFFKEVIKEEFISYQNSLGIIVKGDVENYKISEELIEYIIKLSFLENKHIDYYKDLIFSNKDNEIILPFYHKKIIVKKYILSDIVFEIIVNMQILNKKNDVEV